MARTRKNRRTSLTQMKSDGSFNALIESVAHHHATLWFNLSTRIPTIDPSMVREQTVYATLALSPENFDLSYRAKSSRRGGLHAEMAAIMKSIAAFMVKHDRKPEKNELLTLFENARVRTSTPCCAKCAVSLELLGITPDNNIDVAFPYGGRWAIPPIFKDEDLFLGEFLGEDAHRLYVKASENARQEILGAIAGTLTERAPQQLYREAFITDLEVLELTRELTDGSSSESSEFRTTASSTETLSPASSVTDPGSTSTDSDSGQSSTDSSELSTDYDRVETLISSDTEADTPSPAVSATTPDSPDLSSTSESYSTDASVVSGEHFIASTKNIDNSATSTTVEPDDTTSEVTPTKIDDTTVTEPTPARTPKPDTYHDNTPSAQDISDSPYLARTVLHGPPVNNLDLDPDSPDKGEPDPRPGNLKSSDDSATDNKKKSSPKKSL